MRRPTITEAIKKGLESLPLDIEVWLYGSEARGDARPDSDIDLLVLFNTPRVSIDDKDKIYDVTYPIELDTGVSIQPFIVSKSQWESRMTPFRDNVQTDRIRLQSCLQTKKELTLCVTEWSARKRRLARLTPFLLLNSTTMPPTVCITHVTMR